MLPDYEKTLTANRALTVIFILLICLTNGVLIALQVRKPKFYQSIKLMTVISLAIGDIILAMFPLIVYAKVLYELNDSYTSCRLLTTVMTYQNFFIHFLFGLGLVVLAAEVFLRDRFHTQWNKTFIAVAVSSVPWILGLIVVYPLCIGSVNYEDGCINRQSLDSMFGVSVFLPVSLSNVVCAVLCIVHSTTLGQVIITNHQPKVHSQPYVHLKETTSMSSSSYAASQQIMNQSSIVNINLNQDANTVQTRSLNHRKEAQILILIAIIFGLMVVPYAAITLRGTQIEWPDLLAVTIVTQLVTWVMLARSILTPLIMIRFSNL